MKKVWPEFCPFRTYLRVQHNISDIFERFSISSCNKKMMKQETFKKNSGYMNVRSVTNDFLIITLIKTCLICTSVMNENSLNLNFVPSEPIWGCNIISVTSLKGFLSDHATKKRRRRKPSRQILAIWMCDVWQTISLSLLF